MLLATSGHIPLSPAKVVKANTLQRERSLLSSNPKDRKRKSSTTHFFSHEYGRRVGMVPRSSLKGGKNSLMVEKRTRKPNTTQNQRTPQPRAHRPCLHHHVVFPLCKVKHVRRKRVSKKGPESTNEKHSGAGLCSSKVAKRLQRDLTSPL